MIHSKRIYKHNIVYTFYSYDYLCVVVYVMYKILTNMIISKQKKA